VEGEYIFGYLNSDEKSEKQSRSERSQREAPETNSGKIRSKRYGPSNERSNGGGNSGRRGQGSPRRSRPSLFLLI
jgi:hypothetical protein